MADAITIKALQDASLDAKSLEEVVNGNEVKQVTTRKGETYPSVKKAIKTLFENGALPATPFATKALMTASALVDGDYAMVTDNTVNNGLYVKTAGAWVKSGYDPTALANTYTDSTGQVSFVAPLAFNINYNSVSRSLEFKNIVYVIQNNTVDVLTTPQAVSLPSNTVFRIEYNTDTKTVRATTYFSPRSEKWLVGGYVFIDHLGNAELKGFLSGTIDGVVGGVPNSQFGVRMSNQVGGFSIDTTVPSLTTNNGYIVAAEKYYLLPNQTVIIPSEEYRPMRLEYNSISNTIEINLYIAGFKKGNIIFGWLQKSGSTYRVFGVDNYLIDGKDSNTLGTYTAKHGKLVSTAGAVYIDFNFTDKTMTIAADKVRLLHDGKTYLLPAHTVDLSNDSNTWNRIVYNTKTSLFGTRTATAPLYENEIVVGSVNVAKKYVDGIPFYTVGGKEPTKETDIANINYIVPYGDLSYYKPSEQTTMTAIFNSTDKDLNAFYGLYDSLLAANPSYITKTVVGLDKDGNEIRQYRFNAPEVPYNTKMNKPKVIIVANVHGEKAGTYNTYNAMRLICEEWRNNPQLEALRWGVDFVVVPVVCPYNFINGGRKNGNGVDIARNFTARWQAVSDPTSQVYSGTAPLSEKEAQAVDSVMAQHKDAIAFISHHSFSAMSVSWLPKGSFVWTPCATIFGENLGKSLITTLTVSAKKRYSWINQDDDAWIGYSDRTAPPGGSAVQALDIYGIQGSTFEIGSGLLDEPNKSFYSTACATIGVEALINWLLLNVKHAPEFYNNISAR